MLKAPTFSIVVVCKNPGERLRTALASVWKQRAAEFELIVIDGGSSDGSREWLEAHRSDIATLVSEPDSGIYNAMNKGVASARGEWIYFLGADDRLADEQVLHATTAGLYNSKGAVLSGEAMFKDGRSYKLQPRVNPLARNFVHHQATFYRRTLFSQHGGFDTTLTVMADYDFNLRLWKGGVRFEAIPVRVAVCGTGGVSDSGSWRGYREEMTVRHRYFPPTRCLPWDTFSVMRFLRKNFLRNMPNYWAQRCA